MKHVDPREFAPQLPDPHSLSSEEYIGILHPEGGRGGPALLALSPDERPVAWTFDREILMAQLWAYIDRSAYVSLNRFYGKRTNENLKALNAVFVDLDYFNIIAWRGKSPGIVQAAYATHLDACAIPQPSIFVHSGRGLYAIWLINELAPQAQPRWQAIHRALIDLSKKFGADPACVDEARVLRIPGSVNEKNGKTVRVSGGTFLRHDFDTLADQIYMACGRPTRKELEARKAMKGTPRKTSRGTMPRGLTQKQRNLMILEDLEKYRRYLGGRIPVGQRNTFLHLYASCLTHVAEPSDIEREISDIASLATPDLNPRDVHSIIKQAIQRAGRQSSICVRNNGRYTYKGSTIAQELGISADLASSLCLRQVLPKVERRRRKAEAERFRRAEKGAVSRQEYLEANSASRSKPWEGFGLKRSQYYARKKAGTLPEMVTA